MIERRNVAFQASGAPSRGAPTSQSSTIFHGIEEKGSLTVQHSPVSRAEGIAPTGRPLRHRGASADLWWQSSLRPVAATSATPAPGANSEMLPTLMVGSAIILFKLFMLGLLIYAL